MIEIVGRSEVDAKVDEIYQAVHKVDGSKNYGDITKIKAEDIPNADIFFHSSPCQSFSNINMTQKFGGEEGSETKSSLMWHSLRLIKGHPEIKIVLWENVAAASRGQNEANFNKYLNTLDELGFTSTWKILNPRDFGVPQNRPRLFVVSINRNYLDPSKFEFPTETHQPCDMFDYLSENADDKYTVPKNVLQGFDGKKGIFRERWLIKKPGDTAYCLVAKGGRSTITCNYLFKNWDVYNNLPCELSAKGLHFITEHSNEYPVRALTPREFWKLQSIPDYFFDRATEAGISDHRLYCCAGNGINVYVMKLIYSILYKQFGSELKTQFTAFSGFGCQEIALEMAEKECES